MLRPFCLSDSLQLWKSTDSPEVPLKEKYAVIRAVPENSDYHRFRCFCGEIEGSVKSNATVVWACYCHCPECRNHHSAALYSVFNVLEDDFKIEKGTPKAFKRRIMMDGSRPGETGTVSKNGGSITKFFCEKCGTQVHN